MHFNRTQRFSEKKVNESNCTDIKRYAALKLGERCYAFNALNILEVVQCPDLEPCIDGPELLIGMYESWNGQLPVVDLLNRPPDECRLQNMALVVLENRNEPVGILADQVLDIIEFDLNKKCPVPDGANGIRTDLIEGVVEVTGLDYYLLDLDRLISCSYGSTEKLESRTEGK